MKLIIDIPEENLRLCPEYYQGDLVISQIVHAVKHGIPLDKIRAEIESVLFNYGDNEGLEICLRIIDRYREGESK